jgi:hypothetical protein
LYLYPEGEKEGLIMSAQNNKGLVGNQNSDMSTTTFPIRVTIWLPFIPFGP